MCGRDGLVTAGMQVCQVRCVGRVLVLGTGGNGGEAVDVHQGRNDRDPLCGKRVDGVGHKPGGVLDTVDAGRGEITQGLLTEAVSGHPGTLLVRGRDGWGQGVTRPAGAEVSGVPVDPVADQLDPAVTGAGLPSDVAGQVLWLDLMGVVADVASRSGNVPARSNDAR